MEIVCLGIEDEKKKQREYNEEIDCTVSDFFTNFDGTSFSAELKKDVQEERLINLNNIIFSDVTNSSEKLREQTEEEINSELNNSLSFLSEVVENNESFEAEENNNEAENGSGGDGAVSTGFESDDGTVSGSSSSRNSNNGRGLSFDTVDANKHKKIRALLTNARSLSPKIMSLITYFEELELDIAIVSESWLADSTTLTEDLAELELGTDLSVIYKNRPLRLTSRRCTAGGGIAIVFNKLKCKLVEEKIRGNKFEVVCAKGRFPGLNNTVIIVGIYIQPRMKASEFDELRSVLADKIMIEKTKTCDPLFIIAGDLNKRDLLPAFQDFVDMVELDHGPTRGA